MLEIIGLAAIIGLQLCIFARYLYLEGLYWIELPHQKQIVKSYQERNDELSFELDKRDKELLSLLDERQKLNQRLDQAEDIFNAANKWMSRWEGYKNGN